jgi:5-hydroxyisourate hydrolase
MDRFSKFLIVSLLLSSFSAFAEGISTHVLDLASGLGGENVPVVLEFQNKKGSWDQLAKGITDNNGRIKSFGDSFKVRTGKYKLTFDMIKYSSGGANPFFPEISVVFNVSDKSLHYHVPVVVSPYGYSTYRGN